MTIPELVSEAYETAKSKGWHEEERSLPEIIALMHSELSEALEDYRTGRALEEVYYEESSMPVITHGREVGWKEEARVILKPCGIAIELADVIIRIADTCGSLGIDLERALRMKMDYNKTRPYRHGGKKA